MLFSWLLACLLAFLFPGSLLFICFFCFLDLLLLLLLLCWGGYILSTTVTGSTTTTAAAASASAVGLSLKLSPSLGVCRFVSNDSLVFLSLSLRRLLLSCPACLPACHVHNNHVLRPLQGGQNKPETLLPHTHAYTPLPPSTDTDTHNTYRQNVTSLLFFRSSSSPSMINDPGVRSGPRSFKLLLFPRLIYHHNHTNTLLLPRELSLKPPRHAKCNANLPPCFPFRSLTNQFNPNDRSEPKKGRNPGSFRDAVSFLPFSSIDAEGVYIYKARDHKSERTHVYNMPERPNPTKKREERCKTKPKTTARACHRPHRSLSLSPFRGINVHFVRSFVRSFVLYVCPCKASYYPRTRHAMNKTETWKPRNRKNTTDRSDPINARGAVVVVCSSPVFPMSPEIPKNPFPFRVYRRKRNVHDNKSERRGICMKGKEIKKAVIKRCSMCKKKAEKRSFEV
ncbi:hypothetical protein VTJ04DRAFT_7122 [Mycothermus thermophilus]|uniref:uncharacterized protein n=1 Tax=Humicola insolens TaxID=85995 RepID=UPI00374344A3